MASTSKGKKPKKQKAKQQAVARPPLYHTIWECGNGEWGHGVSLLPMSDDFFWAKIGYPSEDAALDDTNPRAHGYVLVLDIPSMDGRVRVLNGIAERIQSERDALGLDFLSGS